MSYPKSLLTPGSDFSVPAAYEDLRMERQAVVPCVLPNTPAILGSRPTYSCPDSLTRTCEELRMERQALVPCVPPNTLPFWVLGTLTAVWLPLELANCSSWANGCALGSEKA